MRQEIPSYDPPSFFKNGHLNTIYPYLSRKVDFSYQRRERIFTIDDDFLDLDWFQQRSNRLVILSHGLEGNSGQSYIKGMAKNFSNLGMDILGWNFRSCSGELNRKHHFYHSGFTIDLDLVIEHVLSTAQYQEIYLVGFSMGGNQIIKYLGEKGDKVASSIIKAVTISVPLSLESCAFELAKRKNILYMQSFLLTLKKKIKQKAKQDANYPLDLKLVLGSKNFYDFDEFVTAKLHNFNSAKDYWTKNSGVHFIENIRVKTLIMNSYDDPFLGRECFPLVENKNVQCLYTNYGGHVGFVDFNRDNLYYSERITRDFILGRI